MKNAVLFETGERLQRLRVRTRGTLQMAITHNNGQDEWLHKRPSPLPLWNKWGKKRTLSDCVSIDPNYRIAKSLKCTVRGDARLIGFCSHTEEQLVTECKFCLLPQFNYYRWLQLGY
ncbi:hypothetical protein TNCT_178851 [Trichonephila clavata]|uniref:Uncharacterized protein n=1 Tax=Trichonephila clavata TaxID=2740835 RepID=A0A8X6KYS1_TRICU|nr:hypothetical protein TNCT_178851 [Trichonephila clavata]